MTSQPHSAVWRVPLQGECHLRGRDVLAAGVLCNLSLGGAFVAVDTVPRIGENVVVSFALPGGTSPVAVEAVVCWDNSGHQARGLPSGCGLQFLAPARADRQRIEATVRASTALLALMPAGHPPSPPSAS